MKKEKGLSIVELIITIFIVLLVLSGAYFTYTNLLKGFKKETISIETEMEKLVGSEILRLDIEHAGYGVGMNETLFPLEWYNESNIENRKLLIRSTLNNTNNKTFGWMLFRCPDGKTPLKDVIVIDNRFDKTNNDIVLINDKKEADITSTDWDLSKRCPKEGVFIGFPIDRDLVNSLGRFDCRNQICHIIEYTLTSYNIPADCNPYTKKLLRNRKPVLDCVADFKIKYWLDTDLNGKIDIESTESFKDSNEDGALDSSGLFADINSDGVITSDELRKQLKLITIYLLVQEGKYDPEFTFDNSLGYLEIDNIKLKLPKDYEHYRWKVLKITIKPINL